MVQQQMVKQKWMQGFDVVFGEDIETVEKTDFGKLLDSNTTKNFAEGEVFTGNIVKISGDYIMVDIGYNKKALSQ